MSRIIFAFYESNVKANVMYTENYKPSLKEIKDNLDKWKDIPCTWIRGFSIITIALSPPPIYIQSQRNPYQNPSWLFIFFFLKKWKH